MQFVGEREAKDDGGKMSDGSCAVGIPGIGHERGWLLSDGPQAAAWNMAFDEHLLVTAPERDRPLLRLYGWTEPAATFGYFQRYEEVAGWTRLRPLVRRPTGGGLVPHDHDFTYTVVIPPGHAWYRFRARESYHQIHQWVSRSFALLGHSTQLAPATQPGLPGHCFVGAEQDDVLWGGAKIAGAAQRRTRTGLLIQGSVQPPAIGVDRARWEKAMREAGVRAWGCCWEAWKADGAFCERVQELVRSKYQREDYNRCR